MKITPDTNKIHIPVIIKEQEGISRKNEPVRLGVPLPRGSVMEVGALMLMSPAGVPQQCQKQILKQWPDGSLKWVLVDFLVDVPANSSIRYSVERCQSDPSPETEKTFIEETLNDITITTGPAIFKIDKNRGLPLVELVSTNSSTRVPIGLNLIDAKAQKLTFVTNECIIETQGPIRSTVRTTGHFVSSKGQHVLNVTLRYHCYIGCSFAVLDVIIHNPCAAVHPGGLWDLGDPGSVFFKELSLCASLPSEAQQITWQTSPAEAIQETSSNAWQLYQDSSGGPQWNSRNHVDHQNNPTVTFSGFHLSFDQNGQKKTVEGQRATPFLQAKGNNYFFTGAISEFWQNFPKAISLEKNTFSLSLFPKETRSLFELQGGEQKRHTVFFQVSQTSDHDAVQQFLTPLTASLDPGWVAQTKAISYFVPAEDNSTPSQRYVHNIVEGQNSFFNKREIIDEYGWRNFGDLYADHEAVNHSGTEPFISHYNNQYDFIHGACIHFLRTGDRRWWELAAPAARHMIDIDIYHTDDDRAAYNHGLFWHSDHHLQAQTATHRAYSRKNKRGNSAYGGGTSNEHIYSSGLTLYYLLSGDPLAKETVLDLADYALNMDDGNKALFSLFDEGPTGMASQTVDSAYHKPGRGPGNCISCLIDAYRLSNKRKYLDKAEELLQRCIHPQDNIEALNLNDPEYRWSYLVFLQIVGKYLDFKLELGESDYSCFYARDSLLHYADWMVKHETPYKDVLHKVLLPTETWPAHDIRKCHLFHLAAKYGQDEKRATYLQKATLFYSRCIEDLMSFETAYLTRPLVIICAYSYIHDYFLRHSTPQLYAQHCYDFESPEAFIPQRLRFKKHFMEKLKHTMLLTRLLLTNKIHSTRASFRDQR